MKPRDTIQGTNLFNGLVIFHANPQMLDKHLLVVMGAFPYVGDATEGDWAIAHSGDLIKYDA